MSARMSIAMSKKQLDMLERSGIVEDMNKLPSAKRCQVLTALIEGCSVNSTARMTGVSVPAILKLAVDAGEACAEAHDRTVRGVKSRRVQADEIWSFVGKKEKNTDANDKACGMGDAWVWTGIDADSKLIVSYLVGQRTADCAETFITDLAGRLANRVQLSTDGLVEHYRPQRSLSWFAQAYPALDTDGGPLKGTPC